jgi:hypothetical protein
MEFPKPKEEVDAVVISLEELHVSVKLINYGMIGATLLLPRCHWNVHSTTDRKALERIFAVGKHIKAVVLRVDEKRGHIDLGMLPTLTPYKNYTIVECKVYGTIFVPTEEFNEMFHMNDWCCWPIDNVEDQFGSMSGGLDTYMQSYSSRHVRACSSYRGKLSKPLLVDGVFHWVEKKPSDSE